MIKIFYSISLFLATSSVIAQDFALIYEPITSGGIVTMRDLITTTDGNLIVGYDYMDSAPVSGIMKTAADGSILWSKTLAVEGSVAGCSFEVVENAAGNFYLWGLSKNGIGAKSAILSEITMDGDMLWSKQYDFGTHESAAYSINSLDVLPSGNLQMMIAIYTNVIVIQTNSTGEIIWGKTSAMGPPDEEGGKNPGFEWLSIPDDGGMCASKAENDFSLLRYSADGELMWNKTYKLGTYTHCKTIVNAPNGNVLLAGYINYVPHIMEISKEDGTLIWVKTFVGLAMPFTGKSHLTVDGDAIYLDFTTTENQQYVLKMSETGEVLETMMTKRNVLDYNKFEFIDDKESYFYGSALEGDLYKGLILRTTDLFVESCIIETVESVTTVEFTDYSEVDFTPFEWDFTEEADISVSLIDHALRAKYACEVFLTDALETSNTLSVYPNPALNQVTIHTNQNLIGAKISIIDISGKVVLESTIAKIDATYDLLDLPNGQYVIKVQSDSGIQTKKLTILK